MQVNLHPALYLVEPKLWTRPNLRTERCFFPLIFSKKLRLAQMKDVWIGLDETNIFDFWLTMFDQTGQQLQPIQNQAV
jgi:hypothetical protein